MDYLRRRNFSFPRISDCRIRLMLHDYRNSFWSAMYKNFSSSSCSLWKGNQRKRICFRFSGYYHEYHLDSYWRILDSNNTHCFRNSLCNHHYWTSFCQTALETGNFEFGSFWTKNGVNLQVVD